MWRSPRKSNWLARLTFWLLVIGRHISLYSEITLEPRYALYGQFFGHLIGCYNRAMPCGEIMLLKPCLNLQVFTYAFDTLWWLSHFLQPIFEHIDFHYWLLHKALCWNWYNIQILAKNLPPSKVKLFLNQSALITKRTLVFFLSWTLCKPTLKFYMQVFCEHLNKLIIMWFTHCYCIKHKMKFLLIKMPDKKKKKPSYKLSKILKISLL